MAQLNTWLTQFVLSIFILSFTTNASDLNYYYPPAPYKYKYGVFDDYHGTNFGHEEASDGGVVSGRYHVVLPDGRRQIVTYTADDLHGYMAHVHYEPAGFIPKQPVTTYHDSAVVSQHNSVNNFGYGGSQGLLLKRSIPHEEKEFSPELSVKHSEPKAENERFVPRHHVKLVHDEENQHLPHSLSEAQKALLLKQNHQNGFLQHKEQNALQLKQDLQNSFIRHKEQSRNVLISKPIYKHATNPSLYDEIRAVPEHSVGLNPYGENGISHPHENNKHLPYLHHKPTLNVKFVDMKNHKIPPRHLIKHVPHENQNKPRPPKAVKIIRVENRGAIPRHILQQRPFRPDDSSPNHAVRYVHREEETIPKRSEEQTLHKERSKHYLYDDEIPEQLVRDAPQFQHEAHAPKFLVKHDGPVRAPPQFDRESYIPKIYDTDFTQNEDVRYREYYR